MNKQIQSILESFDKKFPCIEQGCDHNGTICGYDRDGGCEPQQCQWCDEKRFPIKSFLATSIMEYEIKILGLDTIIEGLQIQVSALLKLITPTEEK